MQKLRRICCSGSFHFNTVSCFLFALYHQLCFLYMLNYPVMYSLSERERERQKACKELFTLARLKIVPTIKNLIVGIFFMTEM